MSQSADYLVPTLNGVPFLEKPPLFFAIGALCGKAFGVHADISYRIASIIFSWLTITLTFLIARRRLGSRGGLIAAATLSSTWLFFNTMRWIQVDNALVFATTLALYAYHAWLQDEKRWQSALLGVGLGLAFMAKGLVGPALVTVAVLADTARLRRWRNLWRIRPFLVVAIAATLPLTWTIALYCRGGWAFVYEVIVVNNLMRFVGAGRGATLGHQHNVLYYLYRLPNVLAPWTLLFVPAVVRAIRRFRKDDFLSLSLGPLFLLFVASTKRTPYLLPIMPVFACMMASWFVIDEKRRWEKVLIFVTWSVILVASLVPFAGTFLGHPVCGIVLGILATGTFLGVTRSSLRMMDPLRLTLVGAVALSCSMALYFTCNQKDKDYGAAARAIVKTADGEEVVIIGHNEDLFGVLPTFADHCFPVMKSVDVVTKDGLYVWCDKRGVILNSLLTRFEVQSLEKWELGAYSMILARIRHKDDANREFEKRTKSCHCSFLDGKTLE